MNQKLKILLHACCTPCVTVPYQRLSKEYQVDVFFYNPNIHPDEEYQYRVQELQRLAEKWEFNTDIGPYDKNEWFNQVRGLENEPERGARCEVCIRMRLKKTAEMARERGYDGFTSTLTLSPLKDAKMINRIGKEISEETGVQFIVSDFKKQDGFKQSAEICKREGLYRQDYCGCAYSRRK